jgi:FkbM family methyltransferase
MIPAVSQGLWQRARYGLSRVAYFKHLSDVALNGQERRTIWTYAVYDFGLRVLKQLGRVPPREKELRLDLRGARHFVGLGRNEDLVLDELYVSRVYERLEDFIPRPGWIVVDLGANVGMFSVQQARRGAHVFAFEPNPVCFDRLSRAISANALSSSISAHSLAVGATAGSAELVVGASSLAGSLNADKIADARRIERYPVSVTTLDDFFDEQGVDHVDLLKIDVEWSEMDVLSGAQRALATVDRIVMECHSPQIAKDAIELLGRSGFELLLHDTTYDAAGYSNVFLGRSD